ncbi:putative Flp pilus assembly protein CpaB [Burkholderiales bacterium]|nr:putative Flp pilus assembly protein CpaB [Burkholderiales bacterium]
MKFALKFPQMNRNWLMLGGAIALGVVAMALSHKLLHDRMAQIDEQARTAHTMVKVVVASRDVARGEAIGPDGFALRAIPVEYVHASALRPEQFDQFVGQRLGAPLKAGEPLLDVHLESTNVVFSSTLAKGNRALTTEVDEVNSISGMLRPSDHIDLMVTARPTSGGSAAETTFPLMSNVEVLATGQVTRKRDANSQPRTYTTITLSVSPVDAERIVVAKNSGKLTAVLRNPDDARPNTTTAMSIDDMLPKKTGGKKRLAVQYIVGGRS